MLAATYSASAELSVTQSESCCLAFQETGAPFRLRTYPVTDFLESGSDAYRIDPTAEHVDRPWGRSAVRQPQVVSSPQVL
eukprot:3440767-Rhodomonas_salina.1